jgi:hypothetical protein
MKSHSHARSALRIIVALSLLVATIVAFTAQDVRAVPGSVTGTIEIKEAGITTAYGGVTVSAVPNGGTSEADSTVSAPDGSYTLDVEEGLYDIVAEPPDADGFTPATQFGVTVPGGGSTTADFLFIVPESRVPVSGTITTSSGSPVTGAEVTVGDRTAVTNGSGSYRVDVLPRPNHAFAVDAGGLSGFPGGYFLSSTSANLSITAATTIDVALPLSTVDIEVVDTLGNPAGPTSLSTSGTVTGPAVAGVATAIGATVPSTWTGVSGQMTVNLPTGAFTINAFPDPSLDLLAGSAAITVPTSGTVTIVLDPDVVPDKTRVTGRVMHSSGSALPGVELVVFGGGSGLANSAGRLDFESTVVDNRLQIRALEGPMLPMRLTITSDVSIQLTTPVFDVGDITIPTHQTTVTVVDPDGNPVENAIVDLTTSPTATGLSIGPYPATGRSTQDRFTTGSSTDVNGELDLWLLDTGSEPYEIDVTPTSCGVGDIWALDGTSASLFAGTTPTVALTGSPCGPVAGTPVNVTGTITYLGAPIADVEVRLKGEAFKDSGQADTVTDGTYRFEDSLIPDDYSISVEVFLTDGPVITASTNGPALTIPDADPYDIPTIDITSLDDSLTNLTIRVVDQADRPIEGVHVGTDPVTVAGLTLAGVDADGTSRQSGRTGVSGDLTLRLFSTDMIRYGTGYNLRVSPPTGFEPLTLWGYALPAAGGSVTIKLVNSHAAPVTAVSFDSAADTAGSYPDPSLLTLNATPAVGFTVDSIEYQLDSAPVTTYGSPITVTGEGEHTISVWATDSGSVTSNPVETTFTIIGESDDPPATTTTTVPPTTTTTTTTLPDQTTVPPTTTVPDRTDTAGVRDQVGTTVVESTTTSTVAIVAAAAPTTTSAPEAILPVTGPAFDLGVVTFVAAAILLIGVLAVRATRDDDERSQA